VSHLFGEDGVVDRLRHLGLKVTARAKLPQRALRATVLLYRHKEEVADVSRAFAEVFPTSIDQAWSDALGAPGAAPCQRDWQCMATAMAIGDVATPDCDGELYRAVDVAAPGASCSRSKATTMS